MSDKGEIITDEQIAEYLKDPTNYTNLLLSAAVSYGVNSAGPLHTIELLGNYMGMILSQVLVTQSKEDQGEILDEFVSAMTEMVEKIRAGKPEETGLTVVKN